MQTNPAMFVLILFAGTNYLSAPNSQLFGINVLATRMQFRWHNPWYTCATHLESISKLGEFFTWSRDQHGIESNLRSHRSWSCRAASRCPAQTSRYDRKDNQYRFNASNLPYMNPLGCIEKWQLFTFLRPFFRAGYAQVTVFEKSGDVGGVWQSNYAGYALQVRKWHYEIPGYKWAKDATKSSK